MGFIALRILSLDYQAPLSSPNQKKKKKDMHTHTPPASPITSTEMVLKYCIEPLKNIPRDNFTNKLSFALNICYQAADEGFIHSQVNVSDFICFFCSIISL